MADPFVGEVRLFAFTQVVPTGWLKCEGQILQVSQYQALFALLGKQYGGDGSKTFGLPDLRGRVPVHRSLTAAPWYPGVQGTAGGAETVTLTTATVPSHSHPLTATSTTANQLLPKDNIFASGATPTDHIYAAPGTNVALNSGSVAAEGANAPRANMQPFLAMQYCIAAVGLYPPRP